MKLLLSWAMIRKGLNMISLEVQKDLMQVGLISASSLDLILETSLTCSLAEDVEVVEVFIIAEMI